MINLLIIDEIIEGGAIKLYSQLLVKGIKKNINSKNLNFLNDTLNDDIKPQNYNFFKKLIFKNKSIYNLLKRKYLNFKIKRYTNKILNLDDSTILIIPYIIQDSNIKLDKLYEAISKKKVILVIHDLHIYHFPEQWDKTIRESVYYRYNLLVNQSKGIIVHNNFTKDDVCKKFEIKSNLVDVIKLPPFFDPATSTINRDELNSIFDLENIEYGIWASSSTASHKNHERLIMAWKILVDKGYNIKLICTGHTSPRWKVISKLIDDLNLKDYILFTGVVTNAEASSLITNAKFSICPTLFAGGGPVPAAESIIMGIPLLISNIQECRELLDEKLENAYFFNPLDEIDIANSIINLLSDYNYAMKKAKIAQETYLKSRNWEKSSLDYINVVKKIL